MVRGNHVFQSEWTPDTNIHRHDAHEAEKLLSEKESSYISTKRSRATKKRSLKARIKALIAEEISKERENVQEEQGFSFKSSLQRTYSIHHLESLDDGFGKIHKDSKHRILFLPRNVENLATQSVDTTQMKAAGNHEASRENLIYAAPWIQRDLILKRTPIFWRYSSALGLNAKAKFGKSRSFPLAELSQGRKLKPLKLENKQREVWSFPREDKSPAANQAPRLDRSDYLGRRSGEQAGDDESNAILSRDMKAENIMDSTDFEVLGDDLSGNGSTVAENDSSSALLKDDRENVPLNANAVAICHEEPVDRCNIMQIKEDDARLRLHTSDDDTEKLDDLKAEADNLNYSDIITKEIIDQGFILDSDVCLEETECHQVNHQISEGLEPRSTTDELNSSIDFNDLKSLPNKSLSTHMTLNPEKGETPDTVAEGVLLDGHSEKSNSDLYYVRHLLDQSGIAAGLSDVTWHASDQPFSPKLFEKVEACWPHERDQLTGLPDFYGCWHHRMLFDLVGEVLLEVYDMSLPYYPKPLSSSCHVRPFPMGSHIIEEISTRAGTLLNLKPEEKQSLDCIAAHDLYHDRNWMNLQLESECVALDIEETMFNELLEEVIFSGVH
ncbi:UNVERIFIED_CONTAM: protein TRM32 [Sesamum angustifolium]|uniref:Protein TRM32 n=1 Tax=Sesamum angustifolium TaxID=2727405 RepID=A0AAW2QQT0_9LAMI